MAALETLRPRHLFVIHAGERTIKLHERVTAVAAARILEDLSPP